MLDLNTKEHKRWRKAQEAWFKSRRKLFEAKQVYEKSNIEYQKEYEIWKKFVGQD